jgi:hypothetical protein
VRWALAQITSFYDNALPFRFRGLPMPLGRVRLFLAFTLLLSCQSVWADMPPISDEDKKLASVPGQPGAAAAFLYREEIYDDLRHAARIQARIKILTEEGRKYADVSLPYNQRRYDLTAVGGRTIQPDGKVIPLEGKPFVKTIFKGKDIRYKAKTFTLPDVQPGSIIEYKYTIIYPDQALFPPSWIVQDSLWQKQAYFRFYMWAKEVQLDHDQIARGVAYTTRLPKGMQIKEIQLPNSDTFMELSAENVTPFVDEPYMPDNDQFKYNVRFYYNSSSEPKKYWDNVMRFWTKDVEKFVAKESGVAEAVAQVTSPSDPPEQKARKLYAFVVGLDNEDFLPGRTEQEIKIINIKSVVGAEDVLRQKRGDSTEITRTFIALARAAGLKAYAMTVTSRENKFFDPTFLDVHQLDDEIAIVQINGTDVFLDPGAKFSPYGLLDWRHTMTGGYRQTDDKPAFAQTVVPSYKDAMIQRLARLNIKPDFTVEGPIKVTYSGFYAAMRRQAAAKTDEEGRKKLVEDELKSWLPADAEVKLTAAPNWNDVEVPLVAQFQVSAAIASNAGKRVLLPAQAFHFTQKPMFPHAERVNGVYLYYPSREIDGISLTVPPGMGVESMPKKEVVQLPYAMYTAECSGGGNTISIVRDVAMNEVIFEKNQYSEIKGFYDKVKSGDEQQIIFRSAANASASGN